MISHRLLVLCTAITAAMPALAARADDLPMRKVGLWEIKMLRGAQMPAMTMQHCTDESTDKEMSTMYSPMAKDVCAKNEVKRTATGWVTDSVCTVSGTTVTSHSDVTGDFNSAYSVKVTSQREGSPVNGPHDSTMTAEAKWLGPCKADQKAGDIVMPGGFKMNIKDIGKMKALLPK